RSRTDSIALEPHHIVAAIAVYGSRLAERIRDADKRTIGLEPVDRLIADRIGDGGLQDRAEHAGQGVLELIRKLPHATVSLTLLNNAAVRIVGARSADQAPPICLGS